MDGTAVAAIVAAATGGANLLWTASDRLTTKRHEQREKASGVVGRVAGLLAAVNPEAGIIGGIPKEKALEIIFGYWERWDGIQIELEALRVSHPSNEVAEKANETTEAVLATMTRTAWAIHEDRPFSDEQWNDVKAKYAAAKKAVDGLREAIRSA